MIQKHKKQPLNFLKYIGPGLLVTVGFIDPGNWASTCRRFWVWLSASVDGHALHDHADPSAT